MAVGRLGGRFVGGIVVFFFGGRVRFGVIFFVGLGFGVLVTFFGVGVFFFLCCALAVFVALIFGFDVLVGLGVLLAFVGGLVCVGLGVCVFVTDTFVVGGTTDVFSGAAGMTFRVGVGVSVTKGGGVIHFVGV